MSTAKQGKFSRFLRNNAALLLIIFCAIAIGTVVLVVALSKNNSTLPDDTVVVNPNPSDTPTDQPVNKPDEPTPTPPKTEIVKVFFATPLDYTAVSMDYTSGVDFVFNQTLNVWKTHSGVDLSAADGTAVVSIFDGTVIDVSESYGMGNVVKIDHGDNVVATYASLGNVQVVKGQAVKKGDKLGEVSTTASYEFADGAHLHFEVTENGKNVDPTAYLDGQIFREYEITIQQ